MAARNTGMNPRTWTVKETDRFRKEASRLLKVVHSRMESLRRIGRDFGKNTLIRRMREAKKKVREAQALMAGLPDDLGQAVIGRGPVRMIRRPAGQQGDLFEGRDRR